MTIVAGSSWAALYVVMMVAGLGGMRDTTRAAHPSSETVTELARFVVALTSAMVIEVVFMTTALAIRVKDRSADAASANSASCVTSATVIAAAAVLPLVRSASVRNSTIVIVVSAVIVWCGALAGTVPKASRRWTVVFAVVFAAMVVVSYAFAGSIRWFD